MSRRDTILVAVLINMGLLVVLFVGALKPDPAMEVGKEIRQAPAIDSKEREMVAVASEPVDPVDRLLQGYVADEKQNLTKETEFHEAPKQEIVEVVKPVLVKEEPVTTVSRKEEQKLMEVVVKQGDVLEKIARRYDTSVEEVIKINNLPNTRLQIGQILYVPIMGNHGKGAPQKETSTALSDERYYIVKNGDNPWSIAIKNHIKFDELLRLNDLNEEKAKRLKPGDKLRIR